MKQIPTLNSPVRRKEGQFEQRVLAGESAIRHDVSVELAADNYAIEFQAVITGTDEFWSLVNRYYDPATDQFLSVDPAVADTGQPYAFTGDDPLNVTDPLGLKGWTWHNGSWHWYRGNKYKAGTPAQQQRIARAAAAFGRLERGVASSPTTPQSGWPVGPGTTICACADLPSTLGPGDLPGPTSDIHPSFSDPTKSPGPGFNSFDINGHQGFFNPSTGQTLHSDFGHGGDVADHYDYGTRGVRGYWRWYEGDIIQPGSNEPFSPSDIAGFGGLGSGGIGDDVIDPGEV